MNIINYAIWALFAASAPCVGSPGLTHWRSPSHGPSNVLYCYLSIYNKATSYQAVASALVPLGKEVSLVDIRNVARDYGMSLNAIKMRGAELYTSELPLILHMDSRDPQSGAFVLLVAIGNDKVDYLHGGTATVQTKDMEDFLREWSGYALVRERTSLIIAPVSGAVMGALIAMYGWRRVKHGSSCRI